MRFPVFPIHEKRGKISTTEAFLANNHKGKRMLKSWSIENFKPIVNSGELKLAPVTILAGRNSSGKSSLLQSILMITQTLSNQVPDRALLPNERIVQLGTFEDILNEASGLRALTVGFELDFETEKPSSSTQEFIEDSTTVKSAKIIATFSSASGNGASSSAIEASKVVVDKVLLEINSEREMLLEEVEADGDSYELQTIPFKFNFVINKLSDSQLRYFLQKVSSDYLRLVPYAGEQSNYSGRFKPQNQERVEPGLVTLSHFLPGRLARKFKEEERRKRRLENFLKRTMPKLLLLLDDSAFLDQIQQYSNLFDPNTPISEDMRETIYAFCQNRTISENFSGYTLLELMTWSRSQILAKRRSLGSRETARQNIEIKTIRDEMQKIISQIILKKELENLEDTEGLEIVVNDIYVENLYQAVAEITRFFTSQIRYLGPLRADPQASQKFSPSSELDDVGPKGEYSAAVYDANQNARILWYNPFSRQVERGTLKVALDSWARYLDVANQIGIETAGQSGFSWQVVHKKGQKPLPLSAVGVGVSQVLPILVMGLLAPANTLLIIEQPELHLHPGVQARLGDFFVGLSKCKKQCMIETHSENLVSQLRYHIIQSGGQDKSDCIIYFVDQDEKGATRFEPVEISPQGNILNWPDGFFDETMLQEDRITAASIKRRANKVKNG